MTWEHIIRQVQSDPLYVKPTLSNQYMSGRRIHKLQRLRILAVDLWIIYSQYWINWLCTDLTQIKKSQYIIGRSASLEQT
jgi:hypothetical protein